jgi:hypothetical protein
MSNIHVRNVEDDLMRKAKAHAALAGITLRDYIIGLIKNDLDQLSQGGTTRKSNSHKAPAKRHL